MSLIHRGNETVTVFPETVTEDDDGNRITRPSSVGLVARAVVQPVGTGLTDRENNDGGFNTNSRYRLRLIGWRGGLLGAQSQIDWNGRRYAIDGEPVEYNGSPRTARVEYLMVRVAGRSSQPANPSLGSGSLVSQ